MTDKPAILATTKTFRTLADGGVSITFEVSPGDAAEAFKLFGMNGSKVGIAPITAEAARQETQRQFADDKKNFTDKKPSQQAFLLCQRPDFWSFLEERTGLVIDEASDYAEGRAASVLYHHFGIRSRSELDEEPLMTQWQILEAEFFTWSRGMRV